MGIALRQGERTNQKCTERCLETSRQPPRTLTSVGGRDAFGDRTCIAKTAVKKPEEQDQPHDPELRSDLEVCVMSSPPPARCSACDSLGDRKHAGAHAKQRML